MVKIVPELCEINHLYHPLHSRIKNIHVVILRDHKYSQELTPQFFSYVACHMRLIPPPKVAN